MTNPVIIKTVFLKATRERVWKFLTDPGKLSEWFHRSDGTLQEGKGFELMSNTPGKETEKVCWGRVLEAKPYERLVYTFTHEELNGIETTCKWTLESVGDGTVLTLIHDGFENVGDKAFSAAADHDVGWDEHFVLLRKVIQ